MHSQISEAHADFGREKKQRERFESQFHELEQELESVRRSGLRPSQNAETAKEVAKYACSFEISVAGIIVAFHFSMNIYMYISICQGKKPTTTTGVHSREFFSSLSFTYHA